MFPQSLNGLGTSSHGSHTCTRESNFGSGSKHNGQLLISMLLALGIQIQQVIRCIGQIMYAISIIPKNTEILGSRLQSGKTAHGFVGIGNAGGVGIFRHTPNSLHAGIVLHHFFHHIHIGTCGQKGNGHHINTEILGNGKMTVIAGSGAQKLHMLLTAPRLAAAKAMGHSAGNGIEHHVQAGVTSHNHLLSRHIHQLSKQSLHLRQAIGHTIVAAIIPIGIGQLGSRAQDIQHGHGQFQLFHTGLSSGHIQLQAHCLHFIIFCLQLLVQGCKFILVHGLVFHSKHLHFLNNAYCP